MYGAVVNKWGDAPKYQHFDLAAPAANEVKVRVIATALHQLVRSRAAGTHYSTMGTSPPHVAGIDGVGTLVETGELVYFIALKSATGSMAEYVNVPKDSFFPLPAGAQLNQVAALVNGAMSSWMSLSSRADLTLGADFSVCIVGGTGVAGSAAVGICKAYGASSIVNVGRNVAALERTRQWGATSLVPLVDAAATGKTTDFSAAADVDVVLDYLWGETGKAAMTGILTARKDKGKRLVWVGIGALTGDVSPISCAALRSTNTVICGSGPGAWSLKELKRQTPGLLNALVDSGVATDVEVRSLADVEKSWTEKSSKRIVFKP